ncbi:MAG TPA: DUF4351 domain-containing protein [Halomicronema sp.]
MLSQVAEQVDRIESVSERQNIATCSGILAGLRFQKKLLQQLFRSDIMRESVFYQSILEEGLQQGLQEGRQEGKQQEAASLIIRLLSRRLGAVDEALQKQIEGLSLTTLENLAEALLDFSQKSDLITWLQQNY